MQEHQCQLLSVNTSLTLTLSLNLEYGHADLDEGISGVEEVGGAHGMPQHVANGAVAAGAHHHGQHLIVLVLVIPHLSSKPDQLLTGTGLNHLAGNLCGALTASSLVIDIQT